MVFHSRLPPLDLDRSAARPPRSPDFLDSPKSPKVLVQGSARPSNSHIASRRSSLAISRLPPTLSARHIHAAAAVPNVGGTAATDRRHPSAAITTTTITALFDAATAHPSSARHATASTVSRGPVFTTISSGLRLHPSVVGAP